MMKTQRKSVPGQRFRYAIKHLDKLTQIFISSFSSILIKYFLLNLHVYAFNTCGHFTYPCGWLGADIVFEFSGSYCYLDSGPRSYNDPQPWPVHPYLHLLHRIFGGIFIAPFLKGWDGGCKGCKMLSTLAAFWSDTDSWLFHRAMICLRWPCAINMLAISSPQSSCLARSFVANLSYI